MLYLLSYNVSASFSVEGAADPDRLVHYSRQTLRQILFLIIPLTVVVFVGAPLILGLFGRAYAREGTTLLRWLALAAIPYGINAWFLSYARVQGDSKSIILAQALQCVITLGLSYWWLPQYGIAAIGLAWLCAQLAVSLQAFIRTRQIFVTSGESKANQTPPNPVIQPDANHNPVGGFSLLHFPGRANPQTADGAAPVYFFLSPHLDDAVLSCGGLLARFAQAGEKVFVVSVFTADWSAGSPVSWLALRNLRSWKMEDVDSPFTMRCAEDRAAAGRLGVETVHLGFLDAVYRRSADGAFYYTKNTVGVPLQPEDREITGQAVESQLRTLAGEYKRAHGLRVFTPLGLGGHVDHILVRCCAEAVFGQETLVYYEEIPYVMRRGAQNASPGGDQSKLKNRDDGQALGSWMSARVALTPEEIEARIEASACYISQIPGLFPSPLRRNLEIISARAPSFSSQLWLLHRQITKEEDARKRMARILKDYIQRVGGENYWYAAPSISTETTYESAKEYGKE
jgi:LmbE family N-acetylglucosaminyl deacetylase